MQVSEYKNYYDNEGSHFYYVALHELILTLAKRLVSGNRSVIKILDAGTGTGGLAVKLKALGQVEAIDPHPLAVKYSRLRKVKIKQAKVEKIPFPKNRFDLVTCIDILVVVKNDQKALRELWRVTKPGGVLIMRVSAHEWLRTKHEQVVIMRRRYERMEFIAKMQEAGWLVEKSTYMHFVLLPVLLVKSWWVKITNPKQAESNIDEVEKITNLVMLAMIRMENWWLSRFSLPNGIGILTVARKPHL